VGFSESDTSGSEVDAFSETCTSSKDCSTLHGVISWVLEDKVVVTFVIHLSAQRADKLVVTWIKLYSSHFYACVETTNDNLRK
jgi:hypothetical protein